LLATLDDAVASSRSLNKAKADIIGLLSNPC
jgi:hypothetical protein